MATAKERTLEALGKKKASDAIPVVKIVIDGEPVIVDPATFTGRERQLMKIELTKLGYSPDEEDMLYAAIWIVMRRTEPATKFADVLDSVTLGDLADAEKVGSDEDDSPEA